MRNTRGPTQSSEAMNASDKRNKGAALSVRAASSTAMAVPQPSKATPKEKGKKRRTKSSLTLRKNNVAKPIATSTSLYEPQMFIRRIVYKKNDNGDIILGSAQHYDDNIDKFLVLYEDGEEKHEPFSELRNKLATGKVISEALPPQRNVSEKTVTEEKKRSASGEGPSAPAKKKGKASARKAAKSKK